MPLCTCVHHPDCWLRWNKRKIQQKRGLNYCTSMAFCLCGCLLQCFISPLLPPFICTCCLCLFAAMINRKYNILPFKSLIIIVLNCNNISQYIHLFWLNNAALVSIRYFFQKHTKKILLTIHLWTAVYNNIYYNLDSIYHLLFTGNCTCGKHAHFIMKLIYIERCVWLKRTMT